jgi:hypothetical protein
MKNFLILFFILNALAAYSKDQVSEYKKLCKQMDEAVTVFKEKKEKKDISQLLKLARKLVKKDCNIAGVKVKVSVWRACYDQGNEVKKHPVKVTTKITAPYSQDKVLDWFLSIKKENSKEAKEFLNSREFTSTLDGFLICMFIEDEEVC